MKESKGRISVIIPAHNEESCIKDCLKGILDQDYKNKEVIVVNDGSTDRTSAIAKSMKVRVIDFKTNRGLGVARNAAVKESSGDILYFLDADVLIKDAGFLSKMAEDFTDRSIDAVAFRVVLEKPATCMQKCLAVQQLQVKYGPEKKILSQEPEENSVRGFWTIRKRTFLELGGFNEKSFFFEDRYLQNKFYSRGHKALYDPRLVMHDIKPENWSEFMRQNRWLSIGLYRYYRQTGIMYYKAILFWLVYAASSIAGLSLYAPRLLFIAMSLVLLAWTLKLAWRSKDPVHAACYVILHAVRTFTISFQFARLMLAGEGAP